MNQSTRINPNQRESKEQAGMQKVMALNVTWAMDQEVIKRQPLST